MNREILATPSVHSTGGNFSHAVRLGGLTFVSGQVPLTSSGSLVGSEDITAQCRQVFTNLRGVLADIGADFDAIVKLTTYLTSPQHLDAYRSVRNEFIAEPRPASTLVIVQALADPNWLVEVDAIVGSTSRPRPGTHSSNSRSGHSSPTTDREPSS